MTKQEMRWWAWNTLDDQPSGMVDKDDGRGGDGPPTMELSGVAMYRTLGLVEMLNSFELEQVNPDVMLALFKSAPLRRYPPIITKGAARALWQCLTWYDSRHTGRQCLFVRFPG